MRRVNGLSGVLRQYLRTESSSAAACISIPESCSTLQRQSWQTESSGRTERAHHTSGLSSCALPRHHGHQAAFGNPPCMSLFSVSPLLLSKQVLSMKALPMTHDYTSMLQALHAVTSLLRDCL